MTSTLEACHWILYAICLFVVPNSYRLTSEQPVNFEKLLAFDELPSDDLLCNAMQRAATVICGLYQWRQSRWGSGVRTPLQRSVPLGFSIDRFRVERPLIGRFLGREPPVHSLRLCLRGLVLRPSRAGARIACD